MTGETPRELNLKEKMETVIQWILSNKEWIFSGIGVTVLGLIFAALKRAKKDVSGQVQRSGDNSTNIQAAGDISIGNKK